MAHGEIVKRGRPGRGTRVLLGVLLLLLVLTAAVIALRLREYAAGSAYYDSLRGMHIIWKEF